MQAFTPPTVAVLFGASVVRADMTPILDNGPARSAREE